MTYYGVCVTAMPLPWERLQSVLDIRITIHIYPSTKPSASWLSDRLWTVDSPGTVTSCCHDAPDVNDRTGRFIYLRVNTFDAVTDDFGD